MKGPSNVSGKSEPHHPSTLTAFLIAQLFRSEMLLGLLDTSTNTLAFAVDVVVWYRTGSTLGFREGL